MEYDYFNDRPRNAIEEHRRRARYQVYVRVHIRDLYNPFDVTVDCFVELYRMPQDICIELIELLSPFMQQRRAVRTTVPIHTRVLCALFYYASGSYQEHLGTSVYHAVAQSTVSNIIQEVTQALNHPLILTRFCRFPTTHAERLEKIDRNARLGLPGVLGIIDGSIMRITHPPKPNQHYYSRKHFPSLNAMIVCDVDLNILTVNARFPGSSHDSWVYRNSPLENVMRTAFREDRCWLLGDSGYAHRPWMMTPILNAPEGTPEYFYTKLHCRCRNPVERCIGVLKARWRCLSNCLALSYRPEKCGEIIYACVVLHNILTKMRLPLPFAYNLYQDPPEPNYVVDPEENADLPLEILEDADAVRQDLVQHANWFMNHHQ